MTAGSVPNQLSLSELITELEKRDPGQAVPLGFGSPHSYRGYYDQLAFEPARNTTVREMLATARSALGATFQGWKGGDYTMREYTECWLAQKGSGEGETIGTVLLGFMLGELP